MKENCVIGGKTGDERIEERFTQIMSQQLLVLMTLTDLGNKSVLNVLAYMQKQVSTNAADAAPGRDVLPVSGAWGRECEVEAVVETGYS